MTGIGRTKFYELVQAGEIEVIKVGTLSSCRSLRSKPYRITSDASLIGRH
jgi:hypothetical protein